MNRRYFKPNEPLRLGQRFTDFDAERRLAEDAIETFEDSRAEVIHSTINSGHTILLITNREPFKL